MTVGWHSVDREAAHVGVIQLFCVLTHQHVNSSVLHYLCIQLIKALDKVSVS